VKVNAGKVLSCVYLLLNIFPLIPYPLLPPWGEGGSDALAPLSPAWERGWGLTRVGFLRWGFRLDLEDR